MNRIVNLLLLVGILVLGCMTAEAAEMRKTRVGILMFEGVQIIDFAGPYEIFGQAGYEVITISKDGKPLTANMGLKLDPDYGFNDAPSFDVLLVPGGNIDKVMDETATSWIAARHREGLSVLSVCTGAFPVAEAGLLDGLTATTFHRALKGLAKQYPKVDVVRDRRFVDNGRVITSAGLSSGMDAALYLVGKLSGEKAARQVAMHLEYDWHPDTGFVRGIMADRYLPELDLNIPDGVKFDAKRDFNLGDKTHWRVTYKVTTNMAAKGLFSNAAASVAAEGWRSQGTGRALSEQWQKSIAGEGRWQFNMRVEDLDSESGTFTFVQEIQRL